MNLKVIGTGSKGNAYLLENEQEALLIECGVNFKSIKQSINFNVNKIVGCILTHEHGDHGKSWIDVANAGIDIHTSFGTALVLNGPMRLHHRFQVMGSMDEVQIGGFKVKAFDVEHDAAEPMGFLIDHADCGRTLFLTDTFFCKYKFTGLNNILIEANFDREIMKRQLGEMTFLRDRIMQSHMSIQTCCEFLEANDLSAVNNVVLIHLSDTNSNAGMFRERIKSTTGKNCIVASNGMDINFNTTPW